MCLCTLTCTITLLCKQLHFCVGKTETSWTVAGPSGHSHQTHNFQQFRLTTCNRFLPLTSYEDNECLDLTTPEDEADNPIIIPSSSAGDSHSSDSISDNYSTHSVTSLGSTTHNEAHHSIVLPISNEEKSPIYDINILTDSSLSDPDDLPGIKLTTYTSKHKHKTNKSFQLGTPEPIDTTQLPFDIDGDIVYRLPYDPEKKMKSSLDGRPWKTWVTSSRKGLAGICRTAHCKGSYKCYNIQCSYRKQYQIANCTQFEKEEGETVCKCCGLRAVHIDCPAIKVWEFPRNSKLVTIIHTGKHTCVAVPRQDFSKLETVFTENPDLRPGQAACKSTVNTIKAGKSWKEVIEITDTFINSNKVKNMKQKVRRDMHPSGVNFEAVGELKSKMDERDPFYIYRINDRKLNQQGSYVFKTSHTQAKIALCMDRHGDGILNKEYCFMDVKHNRCAGFKTFSIQVYHCLLRRVITLATMECEDETTDTLTQFWILFNEVLQKVSDDTTRRFNPFGWMADEAGANWAALAKVFGPEVLSRTIGCQFHFKQSVNRQANQLSSDKSKARLKQLANHLMQSATPSAYNKCLGHLKDFISQKPHKRNYLITWLDWWHLRRIHVFKAFRATDNAPTTNLAESVHSTWKTIQATNITLVDAAYHDIAETIRIERQLEHYRSGIYQGGTGPSEYSRQQLNYQSQMRRAHQYAAELASSDLQEEEGEYSERMYLLDPECSHRPTKRKQKLRTATKQTKKPRTSSYVHDKEIEELSSSSEESLPSPSPQQQKTK